MRAKRRWNARRTDQPGLKAQSSSHWKMADVRGQPDRLSHLFSVRCLCFSPILLPAANGALLNPIRLSFGGHFLPLIFLGCFGPIPAPGSFTASAFPVPPLRRWVPPRMQPLALGAAATRFWVPQENVAKKGDSKCLAYMLSGIALGAVRSPTLASLEHDLFSLATLGTEATEALRNLPQHVPRFQLESLDIRFLCPKT
jgi:hypothetical protein